MKRNPRVFFSFRSPFSWMALERMHRVISNAHELVEFIPYWEPDDRTKLALSSKSIVLPYTQMSKAKHLYILADTKRLATEMGLQLTWPIDGDNPWWEVPHLGWILASRLGNGPQFYRAVTEARWLRGENICSPDVIRRLADSEGLDGTKIAKATENLDIRADGVSCLAEAYDDDIFGVPYFRIGSHRFWGIDRVDRFIKQVQAISCLPCEPSSRSPSIDNTDDPSVAFSPATGDGSPNRTVSQEASHTDRRAIAGPYDYDTAGGCG